jgi:hypothetical protein
MLDKLYLEIRKTISNQLQAEFALKKTNFQRFECMWTYDSSYIQKEIDRLFDSVKKNDSTKDAIKSVSLHKDGNDLFEKHQFNDAILKYNESLRHSPSGDDNLVLVYADRANAFFELKEFQLSLNDIDSALKRSCPETLAMELNERRLNCLAGLSQPKDAVERVAVQLSEVSVQASENKSNETAPYAKVSIPLITNALIPAFSHKITIDNSSAQSKTRSAS